MARESGPLAVVGASDDGWGTPLAVSDHPTDSSGDTREVSTPPGAGGDLSTEVRRPEAADTHEGTSGLTEGVEELPDDGWGQGTVRRESPSRRAGEVPKSSRKEPVPDHEPDGEDIDDQQEPAGIENPEPEDHGLAPREREHSAYEVPYEEAVATDRRVAAAWKEVESAYEAPQSVKHRELLERHETTSVPDAEVAPPVTGGARGKDLSFVDNLILGTGTLASFVPGATGPPAHEANLQQPGDTAISRPVNPQETKGLEDVLYKFVEDQFDQTHRLAHAYEEQVLKDAEERNRHPGEPGFHG